MRLSLIPSLTLCAFALFSTTTSAQDAGGAAVGARIVPGVAFQMNLFGDDLQIRNSATLLTVGGQLCLNRSADRAFVVEGTVPFGWLGNPPGGEWKRSVPILVGYQAGRGTYLRASAGVVLHFGSRRNIGVTFGASLAVGRNFGSAGRVATEGVVRITGAPEFFGFSLGAQVPVGGRCSR